jgi:NAD(P)-dependent dehydrogenase (short-subunit alcohol dehydrogenase family)
MSTKLQGKIALITGGNSGIGLATAQRFVDEGAEHVYITGRRQEELDAAVKKIGKNITGVRGDVAELSDLDALYATIKAKHNRLDIIFANAGGGEFVPLKDATEGHFDKWFNINVKGLLFTVQKALPLLPDGASIVFCGSIAGIKGMPQFGVYNATKAAVRSLARTWAVELKDRKIRVNVVSPGPIMTPAIDGLVKTEAEREQFKAGMEAQVPLGRIGEPDEVAKAVLFLAGNDGSFVNAAELFVDGGMAQV